MGGVSVNVVLVVTPEEVGRRLSIKQPMSEDARWIIEQALVDAQSDLEAYLGVPIVPRAFTQTGVLPQQGGWPLDHGPVVSVTSYTAEIDPIQGGETGRYTVVYTAGLDAANDPDMRPIIRYVRTHAFYSPEVQAMYRQVAPELARTEEQVTVEGQSVRYNRTFATTDAPGSGAPGTLPLMSTCDKWRRAGRGVYQRPTVPGSALPWPYDWPYGLPPYDRWWLY